MTKRKEYEPPVPLFMIGAAIAKGVKLRGGKLFRISVARTHSHQYVIKYTCRAKDAYAGKTAGDLHFGPEGTTVVPCPGRTGGEHV